MKKMMTVIGLLAALALMASFCWVEHQDRDILEDDEAWDEPDICVIDEDSAEDTDWREALIWAMTTKDDYLGRQAARHLPVAWEDIMLLAQWMEWISGPGWAPEWTMEAGEIILNRVASPFYMDTVEDVLYQMKTSGELACMEKKGVGWESVTPSMGTAKAAAAMMMDGKRAIGDPRIMFADTTCPPWGYETTYIDSRTNEVTYICRADPALVLGSAG